MGFLSKFSRSSSKGHYRRGSHGSHYYKRRGGILGKIIDAINSSRRHSHSHSHHYRRRHSRRSSWS